MRLNRTAWLGLALLAMPLPSVADDGVAPLGDPQLPHWRVYGGSYTGWSAMDVDSVVRDQDEVRFRSIGIDRKGPVSVDGKSADFYVLDRVYDCVAKTQWSETVRFYNFDGTLVLTKPIEKNPRPLTGSEAVHFAPVACDGKSDAGETSLATLMSTGREWHAAAAQGTAD